MTGHPDYVRAPGKTLQQFGMKCYVALVGAGSTRVALSLYPARDLHRRDG